MDNAPHLVGEGPRVRARVLSCAQKLRNFRANRLLPDGDGHGNRTVQLGHGDEVNADSKEHRTFDNRGVLTVFIRSGTIIFILAVIIIFLIVR